jgi:hypothetical protein
VCTPSAPQAHSDGVWCNIDPLDQQPDNPRLLGGQPMIN